jgi:LmbE family N-acetylglucosaminyl deacetylase
MRFFMMPSLIILSLLLVLDMPASGRVRVARPAIVEGGRILFIAAHPDDEVVAAPLLASLCVESTSTCSFLVLTRGEAGLCALPFCAPDLGTVRELEMQSSAALFRASLTQARLPDVMAGFDTAWVGARELIRGAIAFYRPDTVVTFDSLHGTTCHPAHRALGSIVLEAIDTTDRLYFLTTAARFEETYRFAPGTTLAMSFDAGPWWEYAVKAAVTHASQFAPEQVDALRATPRGEQRVWLTRPDTPRIPLVVCP